MPLFSDGVQYCSSDGLLCRYYPAGVCVEDEHGTYSMLVCGIEEQIAMASFGSSDCSGNILSLVEYVSYVVGTDSFGFWNFTDFTVTCDCDARCDYAATREYAVDGESCDDTDDYDETEVSVLGFCHEPGVVWFPQPIEYSCSDGELASANCNNDFHNVVSVTGFNPYLFSQRYEEVSCGRAVDTHMDYGTPTIHGAVPPEVSVTYEYDCVSREPTHAPSSVPTATSSAPSQVSGESRNHSSRAPLPVPSSTSSPSSTFYTTAPSQSSTSASHINITQNTRNTIATSSVRDDTVVIVLATCLSLSFLVIVAFLLCYCKSKKKQRVGEVELGPAVELEGHAADVPQLYQEGAIKGTGADMHPRQESSEDEKSDDLADLYVNDDDTASPTSVIPGDPSPVAASPVDKMDSLDGVYEKLEETEGQENA